MGSGSGIDPRPFSAKLELFGFAGIHPQSDEPIQCHFSPQQIHDVFYAGFRAIVRRPEGVTKLGFGWAFCSQTNSDRRVKSAVAPSAAQQNLPHTPFLGLSRRLASSLHVPAGMSLQHFAGITAAAAAAAAVLLAQQAEGHAYLHYPISRQYARSRDFLQFG